MALHDPLPDFDEQRGWQADMRDSKRNGPTMLLGVLMAALLTLLVLVLAAPMIADAAFARPAICHDYAAECVAAAEGAM